MEAGQDGRMAAFENFKSQKWARCSFPHCSRATID